MFYSTDILLRKDARLALIWRLAVTKGSIKLKKKRQIMAVKIQTIVDELLERLPDKKTDTETTSCFSLRLMSQLLYGACIVLDVQFTHLSVEAKHVYDTCRHIRFEEKKESTKRKKQDGDIDWDNFQMAPSRPSTKKRKRGIDQSAEEHESQVHIGMDYLDRALVTSRSAHEMANITLPEDTMYGQGTGMNDPMFVQPENDLQPFSDAAWQEFVSGDQDMTIITKESSENNTHAYLTNVSSLFPQEADGAGAGKDAAAAADRTVASRAGSEVAERHRDASHFSDRHQQSLGRQTPTRLKDDTTSQDDPNLSYSITGVEGDSRTTIPPQFMATGPQAISSQVDPAQQPILPSEPSQILIARYNTREAADMQDALAASFNGDARAPSERGDGDDADAAAVGAATSRASAGSEESWRDLMDDLGMALDVTAPSDFGGAGARGDRRRGEKGRSPAIVDTPQGRRGVRRETEEEEREEEERKPVIRPRREGPIRLDGYYIKACLADYSDTLSTRAQRRGKPDHKNRKVKAEQLLKVVPIVKGKPYTKSKALNDLYKKLKLDKIRLRADDETVDDMLSDDDSLQLQPWEEIEREIRRDEEEEEEEEDGETRAKRRREQREEDLNEIRRQMENASMQADMMVTTMRGEREEGVQHMSVATIHGDWAERIEYVDLPMETRYEKRPMTEEQRERIREQGLEEEEEDELEQERRRRRTTGDYSHGTRGTSLFDPNPMMDPLDPLMNMDQSRRSENGRPILEEAVDLGGVKVEITHYAERDETRMEAEARVSREKRATMAQVEHHEAREIIMVACDESCPEETTLDQCFPVGANAATAARIFYNLLVLAKNDKVVPRQPVAWKTIHIGRRPDFDWPVYDYDA